MQETFNVELASVPHTGCSSSPKQVVLANQATSYQAARLSSNRQEQACGAGQARRSGEGMNHGHAGHVLVQMATGTAGQHRHPKSPASDPSSGSGQVCILCQGVIYCCVSLIKSLRWKRNGQEREDGQQHSAPASATWRRLDTLSHTNPQRHTLSRTNPRRHHVGAGAPGGCRTQR